MFWLTRFFGTRNDRIIKKLRQEVTAINKLEDNYSQLSDTELKAKTEYFKAQLAKNANLENIVYEAFALVREASKRVLGLRHFDEQLIGGLIMHRNMIAEMRTGEGKTLVATLPVYLNALAGLGVHVVTVNDYLARRDAEWMGRIYRFLGLTVGCITAESREEERRASYNADITYITSNQLGFDYLHDNMKLSLESKVQRGLYYALVDEVDSVLIDESRNPLIISGPAHDNTELYVRVDQVIKHLELTDYEIDEKFKTVHLTDAGLSKVEHALIEKKLIDEGTGLYDVTNMNLVHYVQQSLRAYTLYKKDVDYLVQDYTIKDEQDPRYAKKGKGVFIVDPFTGRVMESRRYGEGLHSAIEVKEGLQVQSENQTLASITFQNFFRLYKKLAGMTGTAMTEAAEFKDVYNLEVISVPTHKKVRRIDLDDEIYGSKQEKYAAILQTIQECNNKGQPVLLGTISIEKSEELSRVLTQHNIAHKVLNAKYHQQEAAIIAQAGRYKAVTIATNMAGRGTDIMLGGNFELLSKEILSLKLDSAIQISKLSELKALLEEEKEKVTKVGGLMVIGSERHESRRIDNQLRGRTGRQGDPGETRFYLSLEDDLMRNFIPPSKSSLLNSLGLKNGENIKHPLINRAVERAQKWIEGHNQEIRKNLLKFDDIMDKQRNIIYSMRNEIMAESDLSSMLVHMINEWVVDIVPNFIPAEAFREQWNLPDLFKEVHATLGIEVSDAKMAEIANQDINEQGIIQLLQTKAKELYQQKQGSYDAESFSYITKYILLTTLDQLWKDHLYGLDHLRQGISLRAYGQKDPLIEYRDEAFKMFKDMLFIFREAALQRILHLHTNIVQREVEPNIEAKELLHSAKADKKFYQGSTKAKLMPTAMRDEEKAVSRNALCPCGSNKKYKYCHGKFS